MISPAKIAEWKSLAEAASPGPWDWYTDQNMYGNDDAKKYDFYPMPIIQTDGGYYGPKEKDRAFIAAARTAVPALIEEVRALAKYIVDAHENLEDRAPVDAFCGECNLGTGPHKATCIYHRAKALTTKES